MAACLVPSVAALRWHVGLRPFTLILYAGLLSTEVLWLGLLRLMETGLVWGVGGSMVFVLGLLVLGIRNNFV